MGGNVMSAWVEKIPHRFSLAQQIMIASFVIMVIGVVGIGAWVGQQIEAGVVHRTAATTALYVDSFISPILQELSQTESISPEHVQMLNQLLHDTPMGQQIVVFKVWDKAGRVLYSTNPATVGQVFPIEERLALSLDGEVISRISTLEDEENELDREIRERLLEIYSPVRLSGTNQVIAAAEFYHTVDGLQQDINTAQMRSWLVIGAVMLVMYVLLALFVKATSTTIARQQVALNLQVTQLTDLLNQNEELHERVRRASASVATLHERFLRRISAELHDGPAQDLSLAVLGLGEFIKRNNNGCDPALAEATPCGLQLHPIQSSLQQAVKDMRAIAAGLGLPQLQELNLTETVIRVVRAHERRTGTKVRLSLDNLPEQAPLAVKITLYRLIQEALNNAYRHAKGVGQQVRVFIGGGYLEVEIADQGAGFDVKQALNGDERLGLAGMRERVESQGGFFQIESTVGGGTTVVARLSLQTADGNNYER